MDKKINKRNKNINKTLNGGLEAPKKIKILVTIIPRKKVDVFTAILESYQANLQIVEYGRGTTPPEISKYLPHMDPEKAIIISIVTEDKVKHILEKMENYYFKIKNAAGIAFSIPIESIIGVKIYKFLANITEENVWTNIV